MRGEEGERRGGRGGREDGVKERRQTEVHRRHGSRLKRGYERSTKVNIPKTNSHVIRALWVTFTRTLSANIYIIWLSVIQSDVWERWSQVFLLVQQYFLKQFYDLLGVKFDV